MAFLVCTCALDTCPSLSPLAVLGLQLPCMADLTAQCPLELQTRTSGTPSPLHASLVFPQLSSRSPTHTPPSCSIPLFHRPPRVPPAHTELWSTMASPSASPGRLHLSPGTCRVGSGLHPGHCALHPLACGVESLYYCFFLQCVTQSQ
jgi:hypothetical protein